MRLPTRERRRAEPRDAPAEDERSSGTGTWWKALAALALGAVGYLAWRRMRSGEKVPWVDAGGEGSDEAGGEPAEGHEVPIEGSTDEGAGGELSEETASGVDPTLEEVDERVEEGVDEEPAEPGTVTVSEDVAEEAGEVEPDAAEPDEEVPGEATEPEEAPGEDEEEATETEAEVEDEAEGEEAAGETDEE